MSENFKRIDPLNWRALVNETLHRRKAEKLTQKEHAALAGVSIPTIVSFDRGEETLSLSKAFDILRVVGLVERPSKEGAQGAFVHEAFARWRALTAPLAENSPGRFKNGWYRFDYALEGELDEPPLHKFEEKLRSSVVRHTGWPLFLFLNNHELQPREVDGVIECWLKPEDAGANRPFGDSAHCDFWRAAPQGRAFAIRGYQEDGQETFPPQTVFDTTLPTWRIGECLFHARNLAKQLSENPDAVKVKFRATYTGLGGRVLRSWAQPLLDDMFEGGAARSDEATLETTVTVKEIDASVAEAVHPLVSSLFERFGVVGLSVDRVKSELDKMMTNNFGSVRS